jgi:DNA-binding CsgD family transcriptional regulator
MEASLTDDSRGSDKKNLTHSDSGELNCSAAITSKFPVLGIAICDAELRYVSVNDALAAMNGVRAKAHIGKTVREVIGDVAGTVELLLRTVLFSGESILNIEIMGKLPSRNEDGYWLEHYFPVPDATGAVKQVGVLVTEITGLRRLENCILTLMGNTPRTRGQFAPLGKPYGLERESVELWKGSLGAVEQSVREMFTNPQKPQQPAQVRDIPAAVESKPILLPDPSPAIPSETRGGNKGAKPLSPREKEIVQLLAKGKSNKEIATILKIAVRTVDSYRVQIKQKLQIHSFSELVLYAVRLGLVKA